MFSEVETDALGTVLFDHQTGTWRYYYPSRTAYRIITASDELWEQQTRKELEQTHVAWAVRRIEKEGAFHDMDRQFA